MTTEEIRENDKRKTKKSNHSLQRKKRKSRRIKSFMYVLLLVAFCVLGFRFGESIYTKKLQSSEILEVIIEEENELSYTKEVVEEVPRADIEDKILLVNKEYGLPEDYDVELILLPDKIHYVAKEAYEPLCDMLEAGSREGLDFVICSAYRGVERQRELFEEDVEQLMQAGYSYQQAYAEAARETMPPGHSEHSTGLAFDIVASDYQMLDEGQEKTAESKWLRQHCAEYGFILRYPKGKEEITDISYESWHFRYVGVEAAKYIMEEGITLEEYLDK